MSYAAHCSEEPALRTAVPRCGTRSPIWCKACLCGWPNRGRFIPVQVKAQVTGLRGSGAAVLIFQARLVTIYSASQEDKAGRSAEEAPVLSGSELDLLHSVKAKASEIEKVRSRIPHHLSRLDVSKSRPFTCKSMGWSHSLQVSVCWMPTSRCHSISQSLGPWYPSCCCAFPLLLSPSSCWLPSPQTAMFSILPPVCDGCGFPLSPQSMMVGVSHFHPSL